jgi:hypothetical protein
MIRTAAAAMLLLLACGDGDPAPAADADVGEVDAAADADPTVVETRALTIGPVTVEPGGEDTVCVVLDLGNDAARMIRAIRTELTDGTHHVIVTRHDGPLAPEPTSCGAFAGGSPDADVLFIAQQREAAMDYPTGSGLPVIAHQPVHLEMHYFNPSDATMEIAGTVHLDLAPDDGETLRPVELLFTGDLGLFIEAGGEASVTSFHALPEGADLFATTAHTHQWGRRATVELATSVDDPDAELLHESTDWAERQVDVFEPITVPPGLGLRLTCEFQNESNEDVGFGLGANDEMCFLWAHLVAAP